MEKMEKIVRWHPGTTPFALAAAFTAALFVVWRTVLTVVNGSGDARPLPFNGLGWGIVALAVLVLLTAVGALIPGRRWQIAILAFAGVAMLWVTFVQIPIALLPNSPGLQMMFPPALIAVALLTSAPRQASPRTKETATLDREALLDALVAMMAASRELPPEDHSHLAEVFLDQLPQVSKTARRRTPL